MTAGRPLDLEDLGLTEADLEEGRDAIRQLGDLLREAGARVTFDRRRTFKDPCYRCDTTAEPRDLVAIGTYTRPMGGNLQPGDAIMRPLCARCRAETEPAAPTRIAAGAVVEWIDANGARRRGKVYSINPEGRVHVAESMTNNRGRRRTKIVTHHFDAHETHRLTVVEPAAPAEGTP